MSCVALLMAGGRGTRMGGALAKPLVEVLGVPLIERNLLALLAAGFNEIFVAASTERPAVSTWCQHRGRALAAAAGARLTVLIEDAPRGTIGAAAELRGAGRVLVQCADNLTGLDFAVFARWHVDSGADMTLASHIEPFQIPFGRLDLSGTSVVGYDEKPVLRIPICSGAYVLGRLALDALPATGRYDAPDLARALMSTGAVVKAFTHEAPWIDVNHPSARRAAVALIAQHPDRLDRWQAAAVSDAVTDVVGALLQDERGQYLVEWRPTEARSHAGSWDTPGGKLEDHETALEAIHRELNEELGCGDVQLDPLCVFEDLDLTSGRWFRHHVFTGRLDTTPSPLEGQRVQWHASVPAAQLAQPTLRAIAYLEELHSARL